MSVTPSVGTRGPADLEPPMEILDNQPSTTMGRFDALYDPEKGTLTITLRVYFDYLDESANDAGGRQAAVWANAGEKDRWKQAFTQIVESTWGERFTFHCTSPAWALSPVKVVIRVTEVSGPQDAHHQVRVRRQGDERQLYRGENRPEPMWDPHAQRVIMLDEHDVRAVPHQAGARVVREAILKELAPQLAGLPGGQPTDELFITFDEGGGLTSTAGLAGLARLLQPWPTDRVTIQLIGLHSPPAETSTTATVGRVEPDEARRRCGEVQQWLHQANVAHRVQVGVMAPKFTKAQPGAVRLQVGPTEGFVPPAPYSTAAHEMGHAFGNVDFYRDDQRRARDLRESGKSNDPENRVQMALGLAQSRFIELVTASRMTAQSPSIGVVADSIMSMGMQVLPIHYLPFWEALTRLSAKHIPSEDWVIVT